MRCRQLIILATVTLVASVPGAANAQGSERIAPRREAEESARMSMPESRHDTEELPLVMKARPLGSVGTGGVALVSAGASVLGFAFGEGGLGKHHDNAAVGVLVGSLILIAGGCLALWRDRRGSRLDRGSLGKIIASALVPCLLISATWIAIAVSRRRESRAQLRRNHVEASATESDRRDTAADSTKPGWELYSQLLEQRIVVVKGTITEDAATVIIAQLLYLDHDSPGQDIRLYIDSPGGGVAEGMAIHDTMRSLKSPVSTVCIGQAAGMAALLLATGSKGHRWALAQASVQLVPLAPSSQRAPDHAAAHRADRTIVSTLALATGKSESKIAGEIAASRTFDADGARAFGLIDHVGTWGTDEAFVPRNPKSVMRKERVR